MKLSEFEKHIQHSLYNQESSLDTEAFIQAIFQKKEKKRRVFPFWWMTTGILLGSVIMFTLYGTGEKKRSIKKPAVEKIVLLADAEIGSEQKSGRSEISIQKTNIDAEEKKMSKLPGKSRIKNEVENLSDLFSESSAPDEILLNDVGIDNNAAIQQNNSFETDQQGQNKNPFMHSFPFLNTEIASVFLLNRFYPKKRKVECPSFSLKKKFHFFVQPDMGISLPQKTLQERIPDNSEVTAFRREHEKTLEGIHAGLQVGMFIGKSPFYASAGFAYSRISEKLDLVYNYTEVDTTYGIVSITRSQNGDTVTVIYGDIITEKNIRGQKIKHHYFHILDIPLLVGYQFDLTNGWSLGLNGGVLVNIGLRTNGQVLHTLNDFKPIEKDKYHTTLGLGYRFGIDVEYALTPTFALGLNTRFTGYGKSFSSPYSNFRQNYLIPGIHLFGRYHFSL